MKPHGQFEITLIGPVLVVSSIGNYNEAGSQLLSKQILAAAPSDQPWAILSDLSNWEMASENALRQHAALREVWFGRGCSKIACVMNDDLRQAIHQKFTVTIPNDQVRYFTAMDEACAWLTEAGFAISIR